MARLVFKFGGSSLADLNCLKRAAQIVVQAAARGDEMIVVVSAMGRTTDHLLELSRSLTSNVNLRELDMLLATGEQQSAALLSMAITELGWQAQAFTGAQASIYTSNEHGAAQILEVDRVPIESVLNRNEIAIVAGFQGISSNGEITTLGRGGSDTTAVALAAALAAERCEIYKDVSGVFTADPHLVPQAAKLNSISYEEMFELANAGAKVMNARAVELARQNQVAVCIRSNFTPDDPGTLIVSKTMAPEYTICSIALDTNVSSYAISLAKDCKEMNPLEKVSSLFTRFGELGIDTEMVMLLSREDGPIQELAFTVPTSQSSRVSSIIGNHPALPRTANIDLESDLARVSLVGAKLSSQAEIVTTIFDVLQRAEVSIQMVSSGDLSMSLLVPSAQAEMVVTLLHKHLI